MTRDASRMRVRMSQFECLLELCEIASTPCGDVRQVFQSNAACFGVIKAGTNGDYLASGKFCGGCFGEGGGFKGFEADAMAHVVQEALKAAALAAGAIAFLLEIRRDTLMDVRGAGAVG